MPLPTTVLLASVLKPLDDTRMLGKFGRALASRLSTHVHVAGRLAPTPPNLPPNLHTHALLAGARFSMARVGAQWRYWQLLRQLNPNVVIVHAPELLPLTVLWRAVGRGRQFVYDVRENYALNIQTQRVYPAWARGLLASLVRKLETLAATKAAGLILAERSYADELPFATPARTILLENKYQPRTDETPALPTHRLPVPDEPLRLLYSGTISELNGVFEALEFARQLRQLWPSVHLTIIGFCQQPAQLVRLRTAVAAASGGVSLIGGGTLVPHAQVVQEIERSHLGLLPYRPHPSTARCVPTKLFEYLAHGLPMVVPPNPLWQQLVERYEAGVCLDFQQLGSSHTLTADFLVQLRRPFYPLGVPEEAFWASEAEKLHRLMDSIQ
ncbi:glycosyltransferase family protein [Hymenobacter mucosus]|nr:glycosyltransferase family 4 protein [Hymenobacter mucosus]